MRLLLLAGLLAACAPAEENCLLRASAVLTEGEAAARVEGGAVLVGLTPECAGRCVRDRSVPPGPADAPALGYCAAPCQSRCAAGVPCELACPPGLQCASLGEAQVCVHGS